MLLAPGSARVVNEFEELLNSQNQSTAHHEETQSLQIRFLRDVKDLSAVLRKRGNPFLDNSDELVTLGTRDIVEPQACLSVIQCHDIGKALHANYVKTRIEKAEVPILDIISRNNPFKFSNKLCTPTHSTLLAGSDICSCQPYRCSVRFVS